MNLLGDIDKIRKEFPLMKEKTYFNSASIGLVPDSSLRAVEGFNRRYQDETVNDDGMTFAIVDSCRAKLGKLINASSDEIAFMPNTSYGINTIALALNLSEGDKIIVPDEEFPANVIPWLGLKRLGVQTDIIASHPSPIDIENAIDKNTKVLAISLVSFGDGFRPNIKAISEICHKNGVIVVVDGIQGIGNLPTDVKKEGIDILVSGGQKWLLSPWGSGFMYVDKNISEKLISPMQGWLSRFPKRNFGDLLDYNIPEPRDATRFEIGTPSFSSIVGMDKSLELLLGIGIENIFAHSMILRDQLLENLGENLKVDSFEQKSSIISIAVPNAMELYEKLQEAGFIISLREGKIRLALHLYNTAEQVQALLEFLQ